MVYNAFAVSALLLLAIFDADGATSTALSVLGIRALECDNISYLVLIALSLATVLSPEVVDQAKARGAQLSSP